MRTKLLLKAKKFFFETFGSGKYPEKKEMYTKMMNSSFVPQNTKIIFSMIYTTEIFDHYFSKQLEPFNITTPQIELIKILYFSKGSSLNQEDIGRYTFASKANVSSHLTKLEKKLLIKRKENPDNKRQKLVTLTKKGEGLLYSISDKINPFEMTQFLTKKETEEFLKLISKVQSSINKLEKTEEKRETEIGGKL